MIELARRVPAKPLCCICLVNDFKMKLFGTKVYFNIHSSSNGVSNGVSWVIIFVDMLTCVMNHLLQYGYDIYCTDELVPVAYFKPKIKRQ